MHRVMQAWLPMLASVVCMHAALSRERRVGNEDTSCPDRATVRVAEGLNERRRHSGLSSGVNCEPEVLRAAAM